MPNPHVRPTLGTRVLLPYFNNNPAYCFGFNAAALVGATAFVAIALRETLPSEKTASKMDWGRANPLSFVRMLVANRAMFGMVK